MISTVTVTNFSYLFSEYSGSNSIQNEAIWLPETLNIKSELPESKKLYLKCDLCKKSVLDMPEHYLSIHGIPWEKNTIIVCGDANFNITDYKCPLCDKDFPDLNQLSSHLFSHLRREGLRCPFCNKEWFFYKINMQAHIRKFHNKTDYNKCKTLLQNCNICNQPSTNISNHLIEKHNGSSIPFCYKNKTYNIVWNYCPVCQQNYSNIKCVRRHIKGVHCKER